MVGCALEPGDSPFEPQEFADLSHAPDGGTSTDAALGTGSGAATMAGTWLQVHEASTCVLVDEQITWASYLIDIEQEGRVLFETRRQCEITLSPVFGLEPIVPDAALDAIEMIPIDNGYVSSLKVGGRWSAATELSLLGVELEDPLTDPMPTDADDPGVIDPDGDGNPGVTFGAVGTDCERYVAQRTFVRYFGRFTTPNQIDGDSATVTESEVVGASEPLCGVSPRLTANDQHSRFRMVRVDGLGESVDLDADGDGEITCAEAEPWFERVLQRREQSAENCED